MKTTTLLRATTALSLCLLCFSCTFQAKRGVVTFAPSETMIDYQRPLCTVYAPEGGDNARAYRSLLRGFPASWEGENGYWFEAYESADSFVVDAGNGQRRYQMRVDIVCRIESAGVGDEFTAYLRTIKSPSGDLGRTSDNLFDMLKDAVANRIRSIPL